MDSMVPRDMWMGLTKDPKKMYTSSMRRFSTYSYSGGKLFLAVFRLRFRTSTFWVSMVFCNIEVSSLIFSKKSANFFLASSCSPRGAASDLASLAVDLQLP